MKPKNLNKKLRLNKETLTHLNPSEQHNAKGGWNTLLVTCDYGHTCLLALTCRCVKSLDTYCIDCEP